MFAALMTVTVLLMLASDGMALLFADLQFPEHCSEV